MTNLESLKRYFVLFFLSLVSACGGTSSDDDTLNYELPELRILTLSVEGYDLDFDSDTTSLYELDLENSASEINIQFEVNADAEKGEVHYFINGLYEDEIEKQESAAYELNLELDEGSNYLKIYLDYGDDISYISYNFDFYRINSTANIDTLQLVTLPSGDSLDAILNPVFDSENYSYVVDVPYTACALGAFPETVSDASTMKYDNDDYSSGDTLYKYLEVGRNFLDIYVGSETGEKENRYVIEVNRAEPDALGRLSNANLASIELSDTDLNFYCGVTEYVALVDRNSGDLTLSFEPEVDGAQTWLNGVLVDSSESYVIELSDELSSIEIEVLSADGTVKNTYNVEIYRRSNNYVYVETVEELAYAFTNAVPNDYIVIAEGDYDISSIDPRYLSEGALYTDRSGSALQPIIVTAEGDAEVNIIGSREAGSALLTFSGLHWQMFGLTLKDSTFGVKLNGSSNIMLSDLEFSNLSGAAVVEIGGNSNMVRLSRFEGIGDAEVSSNIIESYGSVGLDVRQNTFVVNKLNTAILSDASSNSLIVESNNFTHEESVTELDASVVIISSDNSQVNYNVFDFDIRSINQPMVRLGDEGEIYSSGAYVYENRIEEASSLESAEFIFSLIESTYLSLSDYTPDFVELSGTDFVDLPKKEFNIVMEDDPDYCLSIFHDDDLDFGSESEEYFVTLELCDGSSDQSWSIEVGENAAFVKIKNNSIESDFAYLSSIGDFYNYCGLSESLPSVYLDEDYSGFGQRWLLKKSNSGLSISNQILPDYDLTLSDNQADEGDGFSICPSAGEESQAITLVEL